MSRTRRFLSGVGVDYLSKVVLLGCSLWLTRFLLAELGPDEYGRWLLILQYLALVDLLDLGVITLLPREVAYLTGRTTPESRSAAVADLARKVMGLLFGLLPLVVAGVSVFWLVASKPSETLMLPLAALAFAFVLLFPLRVFPPLLVGLQDLAFMGLAGTGNWLVQAGLTIALIQAGAGVWALVGAWMAARLWLYTLCCWRLRRKFAFSFAGRGTAEVMQPRQLLMRGLWVSAGSLAHVMLNGTELIVLGYLLGPQAVVVYSCTGKLVGLLATQAYTLVTSAEPALSELRVSESAERIVPVTKALSQLMMFASGLIACTILTVNETFTTWWVGGERYAGFEVSLLLVLAMLTRHFTFTIGHMLFCFGYERALAVIGLADGVVTLACSFLLISWMGLAGAALASLVGVCVITLPASVYLLANDTDVPVLSLLATHVPWLWRFLCLAVVLVSLPRTWLPPGFFSLAASTLAVTAVYLLVMLPVARQSPLWKYLQPQLASLRNSLLRVPPPS